MATNQTINVDFTPGLFQPALYYVQGDVGRVFNLNLMGLDIPSGASVTLEATKPSGFGFVVEADSVVDGVATFTTTETMTAEWGRFPAGVHISSGSIEVGYASFLMVGQKKTHDEGTIDGDAETIIPELTLLVERVETAVAKEEILHEAEAWAVGQRAGIDVDEEDDTYHNNAKYYAGIAESAKTSAGASEQNAASSASAASGSASAAAASNTAAQAAKNDAEAAAEAAASTFSVVGNVAFTVLENGQVREIWTEEE